MPRTTRPQKDNSSALFSKKENMRKDVLQTHRGTSTQFAASSTMVRSTCSPEPCACRWRDRQLAKKDAWWRGLPMA